MRFQYNLPVNLIFGRGQASLLGAKAAEYGKKALVVTGRGSTKRSGLLDRALLYLKEAGLETLVFDEVEPNPLTTTAEKGAAFASEAGCDLIVGIGGGSIMDAAKAIAFLAENEGSASDYILGGLSSDRALPIILVPTTCGTGSEGNSFAVLTNPETQDKKSLRSNAIVAKVSIIDPELMVTMPGHILSGVGFDALCHCIEAYISAQSQPLTDLMALEGIRLVGESLPRAYADPSDIEAWENLSWGSTLGGMVIHASSVAAAHAMEHPASGLRNITHSGGLAALTPVIIEESIEGAPERFALISRLLGGSDEKDCAQAVLRLLESVGLRIGLREQGISEEDIDWMAENCLKISSGGLDNNPVRFGIEDLKRIYTRALEPLELR